MWPTVDVPRAFRPRAVKPSMRVAKVVAPREIRLEEAPVPSPGPGDILVRVKAVGLCGSDLQYYAHGRIGDHELAPGQVLAHEVAGVVEVLGPDTDGPAPGPPVEGDIVVQSETGRDARRHLAIRVNGISGWPTSIKRRGRR